MKKLVSGIIIGVAVGISALYVSGQSALPPPQAAMVEKPLNNGPTQAAALSPLAQGLDQMFQDAYPADMPGASVIVAKGGQVILNKGYGLADAEHKLPIEPHMTFRLGSLTKQFTAVAILLLEQDGLLKLSDNINTHLVDYPTHGEIITIENILQHTSGIPNYTSLPDFFATYLRKDQSTNALVDLFKDRPLDFKPGTEWRYSNSGYVLLGALIEKLSGQSYGDFVSKRIFMPLSMTNSYYDSNDDVIPWRVRGYQLGENGLTNAPYISMSITKAAGALLASSEDMLKWNKGLLSGALVPREVLEHAWTSGTLTNGEKTGYGFGWRVGSLEGSKTYYHGGAIHGFFAYAISLPAEDIYVAVLSNLPGATDHLSDVPAQAEKAVMSMMGKKQ